MYINFKTILKQNDIIFSNNSFLFFNHLFLFYNNLFLFFNHLLLFSNYPLLFFQYNRCTEFQPCSLRAPYSDFGLSYFLFLIPYSLPLQSGGLILTFFHSCITARLKDKVGQAFPHSCPPERIHSGRNSRVGQWLSGLLKGIRRIRMFTENRFRQSIRLLPESNRLFNRLYL